MSFLWGGCWWHRCVCFMRCTELCCYSALLGIWNCNTGFILKNQLNFRGNPLMSPRGFHFIGRERWRMGCPSSSAATDPPPNGCAKGIFFMLFQIHSVRIWRWSLRNILQGVQACPVMQAPDASHPLLSALTTSGNVFISSYWCSVESTPDQHLLLICPWGCLPPCGY